MSYSNQIIQCCNSRFQPTICRFSVKNEEESIDFWFFYDIMVLRDVRITS